MPGAAEQLQLDIYGEALDALFDAERAGLPCRPRRSAALGCPVARCGRHLNGRREHPDQRRHPGQPMCWRAG